MTHDIRAASLGDMDVYAKIERLCEAGNISPTRYCVDILKRSEATWGNWRRRGTAINLRDAYLTAQYFGVPLEYLADDAMDDVPAPPVLDAELSLLIEVSRRVGLSLAIERVVAAGIGRAPQGQSYGEMRANPAVKGLKQP